MKDTSLVSVIIPFRNASEELQDYVSCVHKELAACFECYEIVLVDDYSTDSSRSVAYSLLESLPLIRYIRLTRQFGLEIAISAGFEYSIGNAIVVLNPIMDPPSYIYPLVLKLRESQGLVLGRPQANSRGLLRSKIKKVFIRVVNYLLSLEMRPDTSRLFAVTRATMNSMMRIRDSQRHVDVLCSYVGITPTIFDYYPHTRQPLYKLGIFDSIHFYIDIIVSNSIRPLRYVSLLGICLTGINLGYFFYIAIVNYVKETVAEGWTTISIQIALTGFILSLVLSVLCEYAGRILIESKDRPLYFITDDKHSSVVDAGQASLLNVVTKS